MIDLERFGPRRVASERHYLTPLATAIPYGLALWLGPRPPPPRRRAARRQLAAATAGAGRGFQLIRRKIGRAGPATPRPRARAAHGLRFGCAETSAVLVAELGGNAGAPKGGRLGAQRAVRTIN